MRLVRIDDNTYVNPDWITEVRKVKPNYSLDWVVEVRWFDGLHSQTSTLYVSTLEEVIQQLSDSGIHVMNIQGEVK